MNISLPEFTLGMAAFLMAAAFFAGFIDSVAGGGGLISLPAMLLAGFPPHTALGTGKFMATVGTCAAFFSFARNGAVIWPIAASGAIFSFAGSAAGAETAVYIDNTTLGKVILFLLPAAALATFFSARKKTSNGNQLNPKLLFIATPVICLMIGFYDGFFGPGTGSFLLLALHLALGLNLVAASGTAKAFNLASNISGLVIFLFYGKVWFLAALPMAAANMAGNVAGARLAIKNGPKLVQKMLFFSLSLLFISLFYRYVA